MLDFGKGSVPVSVAARVYGKDAAWVRAGIISGWLPIGFATRNGEQIKGVDEIDSKKGELIDGMEIAKRLYEETGYIWKGEKE